jgi:translation initiation factor 1A
MPKKGKGGKKHRKSKNDTATTKRELTLRDEGQEYAVVLKMLGDGRLTAACNDGKERLGIIRGAMRKRVYIRVDDFILLGLREFQDDKADVIHKYSPEEVRSLKKMGQISESMKAKRSVEEEVENKDEDDVFVFEDI